MEKESVFDELRKRLSVKKLVYQSDWCKPESDIGIRLEREIAKMDRPLTPEERSLAIRYLVDDCVLAQSNADTRYKLAENNNPHSQKYGTYLKEAQNLTMRATGDTKMLRKLSPDMNYLSGCRSYDAMFSLLTNFRRKLYFMREFPLCHNEAMILDDKLRFAVKREDYESAAKVRDQIRGLALKD